MLHVTVSKIQAPVRLEDGRETLALSEMRPREIEYAQACFSQFTDMVFVLTGGALRIEANEWVIQAPATRLSSPGAGRYWLAAPDALGAEVERIPRNVFDSIGVYYKMPPGIRPALHGGAVGQDHGVRGAAYWTLWLTRWDEPINAFNSTSIASLHEWLHNVSYYAHHVMGETTIPDCHAGEEHGYWDLDGGYPQWQAWNRDLMLRFTPSSFWRRLTSRRRLFGPGRWIANPGRRVGGFHRWDDVAEDWMRLLPQLEENHLRRFTGWEDLTVETGQPGPNTHLVWALRTRGPVASPYHRGPLLEAPLRLDNVLAFGRRPRPTVPSDPLGGYADAPIESVAWLRSPSAPRDRRDLLLLRPDLAPWLLPRLGSEVPAADRLLGFMTRRDPSEGQPVSVLVAAVDLGDPPPLDEVAAASPPRVVRTGIGSRP
jgi:hypothetical protein